MAMSFPEEPLQVLAIVEPEGGEPGCVAPPQVFVGDLVQWHAASSPLRLTENGAPLASDERGQATGFGYRRTKAGLSLDEPGYVLGPVVPVVDVTLAVLRDAAALPGL